MLENTCVFVRLTPLIGAKLVWSCAAVNPGSTDGSGVWTFSNMPGIG